MRPVPAAGPVLVLILAAPPAAGVELVTGGKPVAVVVSDARPVEPKGKGARKQAQNLGGDTLATKLVVEWVKKITDAELPVADKAPADRPAIYVGRAAVRAGLTLDDIDSPTREGVRVVVEGNRVLIGGQSDAATVKAAARFLEELGCRYFMDGPLGEVFPRSADLAVKPLTITEKPGLLYRNPKGPSWRGGHWKEWNGAGGEEFHHAHSWGRYIPRGLFAGHPEYFAMGPDGNRRDEILGNAPQSARGFFAVPKVVE